MPIISTSYWLFYLSQVHGIIIIGACFRIRGISGGENDNPTKGPCWGDKCILHNSFLCTSNAYGAYLNHTIIEHLCKALQKKAVNLGSASRPLVHFSENPAKTCWFNITISDPMSNLSTHLTWHFTSTSINRHNSGFESKRFVYRLSL